ncbi:HAD family phosphatase [Nocardia beijingensis]|uniref:HAD family hydrolase n=1 Tax=Nocardia beijingensis TaxID=95162 RepID=UPI0018932C87|nr:HAD family phosphatase [Nocardia beijingensis]MBF6465631.1 HAD family phosphatase [Nocardia beijingensis]
MSELRAVLWDLDGTILDTEKLWHDAVDEFVTERGGVMTAADRRKLVGATVSRVLHTMLELAGIEPSAAALREADAWLGSRLPSRYVSPVPWRPGAEAALRAVRAADMRSALVTNTSRALADVAMGAIGREYFDASVTGDEVAHGKPAPDPYVRGAELLGVAPDACVAIEDSLTGAAAAVAAGCGVLLVPCDVPATAVTHGRVRRSLDHLSISDLQEVLRSLASGG